MFCVSGKDEKKAERSERKYVLPNRESTLRSNQPLRNLNQGNIDMKLNEPARNQ